MPFTRIANAWDRVNPNACRFQQEGHVESYFLRANDPSSPRAFWLKATIFAPIRGESVAESWFIWFDATKDRTFGHKVSEPVGEATFLGHQGGDLEIRTRALRLFLGTSGSARGTFEHPTRGTANVDVTWSRPEGKVAAPLSVYRWTSLLSGPFPKSKLVTPFPVLGFSGRLSVTGEEICVDGWNGMQGHNWGKEHAHEYAWAQCNFAQTSHRAVSTVEAVAGRVLILGQKTPFFSAMVVRSGEAEYVFDRLFDLWRQDATIEEDRFTLGLWGPDGEARLSMDSRGRPAVCLVYDSPTGSRGYCINTKLARTRLSVQPRKGAPFELTSEHGGALEFLRPSPDPRFSEMI